MGAVDKKKSAKGGIPVTDVSAFIASASSMAVLAVWLVIQPGLLEAQVL